MVENYQIIQSTNLETTFNNKTININTCIYSL